VPFAASAPRIRPHIAVAAAAVCAAVLVSTVAMEAWVRATWDVRRGAPGFYVPDPTRGQRLSENYSGWFAGVPVHINSLGLRDSREYDLAKKPNTFRILVLGDSVTFGHGSVYEHTYPYLLEQRLKTWRPDIDWQVWNAAVPGYNTSQELAQLLEVGPRFDPELVIVGFYDNDVSGNTAIIPPTRVRRAAASLSGFARRHVWSIEFYRRLYYTIQWRLTAPSLYRRRLDTLARDQAAEVSDATKLASQRLTPYEWLPDEAIAAHRCGSAALPCANEQTVDDLRREPTYGAWLDAVRAFQRLNAEGRYRIMFFLNVVPRPEHGDDYFSDAATRRLNTFFLDTLGRQTPAVSVHDAFLHVRPSQMPGADGHSLGNANDLKAGVLFDYLRDCVLPGAVAAMPHRQPPA
jgi:GDSL-like Lipase/Acylhydrolase family